MANEKAIQETRDGFQSKWGFILACVGSAVGMGNIWRLPIMVSKYGGLTFLIPFFLFIVLIGATGVIGEFSLGRSAGAGPVGAFGKCTKIRTGNQKIGERVGAIPIIGALALAIGYTCVIGWIFKYTVMSVNGNLFKMGQDMDTIVGTFESTAGAWGANVWIIIAIIASFAIMVMGVAGGIEKANKIMMPLLFLMFLALAVYIATIPGAMNGYRYIFTLNPKGLMNPEVWIFAFGQAFFSMSVAGNGSVIYGSYLSKSESIPGAALNVAFFNSLSAILSALVVIPAMAVGNAELSSGGPGLMFIYLVNVMNGMAGGRIVGVVFFICVTFAGVSSIINLYEAPVAFLQEQFGMKRLPATASILAFGGAVALFIQAVVSNWMDIVSIYLCPLGALLAAVFFFWIAGKEYVEHAVSEGMKEPIGSWFYPLGKYVYCSCAAIALVAGIFYGGIG